MFIPEYTITSGILKDIAAIEYARAVIDLTTILPVWETQFLQETQAKRVHLNLIMEGLSVSPAKIRNKLSNNKETIPHEAANMLKAYNYADETSQFNQLDEENLRKINKILTDSGAYRRKKVDGTADPAEILADVTELFDWYNSLDARQTHPIILAAIMKGQLERIMPFGSFNISTANLVSYLVLRIEGFEQAPYISFEEYFSRNPTLYAKNLHSLSSPHGDMTEWVHFFTSAMAAQTAQLKENLLLLEKDTVLAKATGRVELSERQEKIIRYLNDFGILTNKTFARLFPDISEDTVLRDLKDLIDRGLIVKKGRTKNSRYELK